MRCGGPARRPKRHGSRHNGQPYGKAPAPAPDKGKGVPGPIAPAPGPSSLGKGKGPVQPIPGPSSGAKGKSGAKGQGKGGKPAGGKGKGPAPVVAPLAPGPLPVAGPVAPAVPLAVAAVPAPRSLTAALAQGVCRKCLRSGHIRDDCPNGRACRHCFTIGWEFDHDPSACRFNFG